MHFTLSDQSGQFVLWRLAAIGQKKIVHGRLHSEPAIATCNSTLPENTLRIEHAPTCM
jgi:hypothetical protein